MNSWTSDHDGSGDWVALVLAVAAPAALVALLWAVVA